MGLNDVMKQTWYKPIVKSLLLNQGGRQGGGGGGVTIDASSIASPSYSVFHGRYTPIPLDGVSAMFRNFGQNDTKRGRNAKSAAETSTAQ